MHIINNLKKQKSMSRLIYLLGIPLILLTACGGEKSKESDSGNKAMTIETKDINGTINASPEESRKYKQNSNQLESEGQKLVFDGGKIMIYLSPDGLEKSKKQMKGSALYDKFEVVDSGDDYFLFYLEKRDKKGYGFKRFVSGKGDETICLEGTGDQMLKPIAKEKKAKELLKIAQTFEKK